MGRSKGFAFADMKSENDVSTAVAKLNGYDMDGRSLTVRIGKKRES
jgi:RNA recognition motif-containing protein